MFVGEAADPLPYGELLDDLATTIFGGPGGAERFNRSVASFDEALGTISEEDEDFALLQAIRTDHALCDAHATEPLFEPQPGDTWAWRAATGRFPLIEPDGHIEAIAASFAGLFEVWPGRRTWVRDRISGRVVPLLDEVVGVSEEDGPALWELRLVPEGEGARLARPPLVYPAGDLLPYLERTHARRFTTEGGPSLGRLRRARLVWIRSRRRVAMSAQLERGRV